MSRYVAAVIAMLLLGTLVDRAWAASVRLRWRPSNSPSVTGYRVYVRPAGSPYGAPRNAGRPPLQADGTMAFVVDGLTAGRTYYLAATAYTSSNVESALSGELRFGTATPCRKDRCSSLTSCDFSPLLDGTSCDDGLFCNGAERCAGGTCKSSTAPVCADTIACTVDTCSEALKRCVHQAQAGCCTADSQCADADLCTTGERCAAGACVSMATTCFEGPCLRASCDPATGCDTEPIPDGTPCTFDGPCVEGTQSGTCEDGLCRGSGSLAPTSDVQFDFKRLRLMASGANVDLIAKGVFTPVEAFDLTASGATVRVSDPSGAVIYRAVVPPGLIVTKLSGQRFRFVAGSEEELAQANGIRRFDLRMKKSTAVVTVLAETADLGTALTRDALAWSLQLEDQCVHAPDLECAAPLGDDSFRICN